MLVITIIFAKLGTLPAIILTISIASVSLIVALIFTALDLIGPDGVTRPVTTITRAWATVWTIRVAGTLGLAVFFSFLALADAVTIAMACFRANVRLINARLNASSDVAKMIFDAFVKAWSGTRILAKVATVHIFPVELWIATIITGAWATVFTSRVAWALPMTARLLRVPHNIALILARARLTLTVTVLAWFIAFGRAGLFLITPHFQTLVQISGLVRAVLGTVV